MKYIKVTEKIYTSPNSAYQDKVTGNWFPATPELYSPNLREWFIHNIQRKHFSWGQPYCVVCGKVELPQ